MEYQVVTYTATVACKQCGKTAIIKKEGVKSMMENSSGGAFAQCMSCYQNSNYDYVLTNGAFTRLA